MSDTKIYDFYFSKMQRNDLKEFQRTAKTHVYVKSCFKGQEFTCAQTQGTPAPTNYDDYEKVGTGTYADVTYPES